MKTIIHVNQHVIKANRKNGEVNPVLTCKTYKGTSAHGIIRMKPGNEAARYLPGQALVGACLIEHAKVEGHQMKAFVCSGIDRFCSMASSRLGGGGFAQIDHAKINKGLPIDACAVLAHHYPTVTNYKDIRNITKENLNEQLSIFSAELLPIFSASQENGEASTTNEAPSLSVHPHPPRLQPRWSFGKMSRAVSSSKGRDFHSHWSVCRWWGIVSDGVFFQALSSECLNKIECSLLSLEPPRTYRRSTSRNRSSDIIVVSSSGRQKGIRPSIWKAFCFHAMIADMEQS